MSFTENNFQDKKNIEKDEKDCPEPICFKGSDDKSYRNY
jgi:hypothetical protein